MDRSRFLEAPVTPGGDALQARPAPWPRDGGVTCGAVFTRVPETGKVPYLRPRNNLEGVITDASGLASAVRCRRFDWRFA